MFSYIRLLRSVVEWNAILNLPPAHTKSVKKKTAVIIWWFTRRVGIGGYRIDEPSEVIPITGHQ